MIIFGTTTLQSNRGSGNFNCPRCSMPRTYRHKKANRFFTLYFIPLIPLGSAGEYVECMSCGGTYGLEVLQYNPEANRAELIADLRRVLSLVLMTSGRTDRVHLEALARICGESFGQTVSLEQVEEDLRLARSAGACLVPYVQGRSGNFSDKGKQMLLAAASQMLGAHGSLSELDRDVLRQLGQALGTDAPPAGSPFSR